MEYNQFFPYINPWLPDKMEENSDFLDYLSRPNILEDFAEMFVMTLPGDRISYYKTSDVEKLRHDVFAHTNQLASALGDYPVTS